MRILRTVVSPSTSTMSMLDSKITLGRDKIVNRRWPARFLQELAHQFQRRGLISLSLDQDIQNLPFVIYGGPHMRSSSLLGKLKLASRPVKSFQL